MSVDFFKRTWVFLLLLAVSFFCLFAGIRVGLNTYDEGHFVYGAMRIVSGEMPYRDFWTIYPPGQFYLLALLFRIFGPSLMVERILSAAVYFSIVLSIFCLTESLTSSKWAVLSWLLGFLWVGSFGFFGSSTPVAVLLSLLSCYWLIRFFKGKGMRSLWLAGIFAGVTVPFRHDLGFYCFLSGSALLILFVYRRLSEEGKAGRERFLRILEVYGRYVAGTLAIFIPLAAFFIWHTGLEELLSDLILFPLKVFPQFRSLPYPGPIPDPIPLLRGEQPFFQFIAGTLDRFPFYFPLIVFFTAVLGLFVQLWKRQGFFVQRWSMVAFLFLGLTFFNQARVRSDAAHLFPTMIPAIILLPLMLSEVFQKSFSGFSGIRRFSCVFTLWTVLSFGHHALYSPGQYLFASLSPDHLAPLNLQRARGVYMEPGSAADLEGAVKFVQEHVPRKEKIFVGNWRHDQIFANDIMFYFLSERDSATQYHELQPGLATTRSVQREIIRDLVNQKVNYVVLWRDSETNGEPNKSSESSGVIDLDDFIRSHYTEIANFGPYAILERVKQSRR